MQKYPNLDRINAATHGDWNSLLESAGQEFAPMMEPHDGYRGPEVDFNCEVLEVGSNRTLVLAWQTAGYDLNACWLLGYLGTDDVPTIFSPNAASVELALRWVRA